jgi:hypothetical protein
LNRRRLELRCEVRLHNRSEKGSVAPCSWTPQESQVERYEHQDDSNIHCQPFPESVSEEHEIHTGYDGCHRHHVKHDSYLSAHFSLWFNRNSTNVSNALSPRSSSSDRRAESPPSVSVVKTGNARRSQQQSADIAGHCGAETRLYKRGVPICMACVDDREKETSASAVGAHRLKATPLDVIDVLLRVPLEY